MFLHIHYKECCVHDTGFWMNTAIRILSVYINIPLMIVRKWICRQILHFKLIKMFFLSPFECGRRYFLKILCIWRDGCTWIHFRTDKVAIKWQTNLSSVNDISGCKMRSYVVCISQCRAGNNHYVHKGQLFDLHKATNKNL